MLVLGRRGGHGQWGGPRHRLSPPRQDGKLKRASRLRGKGGDESRPPKREELGGGAPGALDGAPLARLDRPRRPGPAPGSPRGGSRRLFRAGRGIFAHVASGAECVTASARNAVHTCVPVCVAHSSSAPWGPCLVRACRFAQQVSVSLCKEYRAVLRHGRVVLHTRRECPRGPVSPRPGRRAVRTVRWREGTLLKMLIIQ